MSLVIDHRNRFVPLIDSAGVLNMTELGEVISVEVERT
jgi:hypothetical protein